MLQRTDEAPNITLYQSLIVQQLLTRYLRREQIEEVGTDSLEVGFVLFSHGLMTQEDWDERKSIHHLAWQQQQGSATMLETANQIWRIRGGAASQAGPSAPNDTNPYL